MKPLTFGMQRVRRYESSPRNIAMISSVVGPGPAVPNNLANRLGGRVPLARSMTMHPSAARLKATSLPGSIPE
jgi:hypothetical protein